MFAISSVSSRTRRACVRCAYVPLLLLIYAIRRSTFYVSTAIHIRAKEDEAEKDDDREKNVRSAYVACCCFVVDFAGLRESVCVRACTAKSSKRVRFTKKKNMRSKRPTTYELPAPICVILYACRRTDNECAERARSGSEHDVFVVG